MEKICKSCGFSENPIDASFCGRCGSKLSIEVDKEISKVTSKIQLKPTVSYTEKEDKASENVKLKETKKNIGRNDPCPCGSGRKYRKCHGRGIV